MVALSKTVRTAGNKDFPELGFTNKTSHASMNIRSTVSLLVSKTKARASRPYWPVFTQKKSQARSAEDRSQGESQELGAEEEEPSSKKRGKVAKAKAKARDREKGKAKANMARNLKEKPLVENYTLLFCSQTFTTVITQVASFLGKERIERVGGGFAGIGVRAYVAALVCSLSFYIFVSWNFTLIPRLHLSSNL
jgi:hypothetical protein